MPERYAIVTDSGADLPREILTQLDVISLPLEIHLESGETRLDGETDPKALYARLREKEKIRTSSVNEARFLQGFLPHLEAGKDILYIGFSSALSATFAAAERAARALAERYPERKILTLDSLCASLGEGLLVTRAARAREGGESIEALYARLLKERWHIAHEFTVSDLFFLKRGGRVSAASAVLGSLLSVKPVMYVDNGGRLIKRSTVRGRRASLLALFERMKQNACLSKEKTVYISHGDCFEDALFLKHTIEAEYPDAAVTVGYVGAVIGSHSGPDTVALFYYGKER